VCSGLAVSSMPCSSGGALVAGAAASATASGVEFRAGTYAASRMETSTGRSDGT
jgi:hypothetical protein